MTTPDTCWCTTCRPMTIDDPGSMRMALCPTCGNKRCPRAHNHALACTNSNEPGQAGSSWEHVRPVRETVVYAPRLTGKHTYLESELLELAAKAAGQALGAWFQDWRESGFFIPGTKELWNPLTNDGDALRLAAAIGQLNLAHLLSLWGDPALYKTDPAAAIRRAIVLAAAAIGKAMP